METTPCKYCAKGTYEIETALCNSCYEVDRRLDEFAKDRKGRVRMLDAIGKAVLKGRVG